MPSEFFAAASTFFGSYSGAYVGARPPRRTKKVMMKMMKMTSLRRTGLLAPNSAHLRVPSAMKGFNSF